MRDIKFIGSQWPYFFVIVILITIFLGLALALLGVGIGLSILISLIAGLLLATIGLIEGFRFLRNSGATDIGGRGYTAVPQNHVAIVLENGKYHGYLEPGYYFIFPFFRFNVLKETIFLGTVENNIFDDGNKVDFHEGISAGVEAVFNYRVVEVGKYAFEGEADKIIRGIISSLTRTSLGKKNAREAREGGLSLTDIEVENPSLFASIRNVYGVEIMAINISDVELSEEEIVLNRQRHEAKINKEIALDKAEEMKILAKAEAKTLELTGGGLRKQVELLAKAGCSPDTILAYLAETKKWQSLSSTDKTFIIDNGKSVGGMLAALKNLNVE
ncbi:MAG: SPFH domain-containing protein [Patescibacteria group bacterium]|jgi:regulator of protease activity HflC (stomatin/prohibitin superfamily)|nr:SPFH domain-containing protein [Patescibacteria group bacterium]